MVNPALALFDHGLLVDAERVPADRTWSRLCVGERCRQVGKRLLSWLGGRAVSPTILVTEWPQIYTADKSRGDPNDLPPMAGVAMYLAGRLDLQVQSYLPAEWLGGTCPKSTIGNPWESPRGQRVWDALSESERRAVVPSHDAIDSVGIGLRYLGRFGVAHAYSGSS